MVEPGDEHFVKQKYPEAKVYWGEASRLWHIRRYVYGPSLGHGETQSEAWSNAAERVRKLENIP